MVDAVITKSLFRRQSGLMHIGTRKLPEAVLRLSETVVLDPLSTWWARFGLFLWGAEAGKGLKVSGRLRLRIQGGLRIGNRVRLLSGYSNYVGASEPISIWVSPNGCLNIGDDCGLSNTTIVCRQQIDILEETFIGGGCRIYDNDFHQIAPEDRLTNCGIVPSAAIRIGPRAFIGAHCIVLKGVSIGEASVIGAGSLVTKSVPPWEVWGGVPAHFIKKINKANVLLPVRDQI